MKSSEWKDWLKYAKKDIDLAEKLVFENGFVGHIIFLCHEAVEKYLKALLIFLGKEFPYVHDLETLAVRLPIPENDQVSLINIGIMLNTLYPAARYPGRAPITIKDAKKAFEKAKEAETIVLKYMTNV